MLDPLKVYKNESDTDCPVCGKDMLEGVPAAMYVTHNGKIVQVCGECALSVQEDADEVAMCTIEDMKAQLDTPDDKYVCEAVCTSDTTPADFYVQAKNSDAGRFQAPTYMCRACVENYARIVHNTLCVRCGKRQYEGVMYPVGDDTSCCEVCYEHLADKIVEAVKNGEDITNV